MLRQFGPILLILALASNSPALAEYVRMRARVDPGAQARADAVAKANADIAKDSADADKWRARGMEEYRLGQYAQAVSSLSMSISREPKSDTAHYYLANALWNTRQINRALQEYQRALETSQSSEMTENCQTVLARYHFHTVASAAHTPKPAVSAGLTDISGMANGTHAIRGYGAPGTGSVSSFMDAAASNGARNLRNNVSHSDGVAVFNSAPTRTPSFNSWQMNFRLAFERAMSVEMDKRGVTGRCGKYSMIFSCDASHQLRGKILDTNAPDVINESLLAATKQLDGSRILQFPDDIGTSGFNFTLAWDNPPVRTPVAVTPTPIPRVGVDTLVRNYASVEAVPGSFANTKAVISTAKGLKAVPGRLKVDQSADKNVNAALLAKQGLQAITAQLPTSVEEVVGEFPPELQAFAGVLPTSNLPQFDVVVEGKVLPRPAPIALKATQQMQSLDAPATTRANVSGKRSSAKKH
jgi:Tetratricopeptide repeat